MILGAPLPSWREILFRKKKRIKMGFYDSGDELILAESCMSINLILKAYRDISKKQELIIWLPDFFCDQTIASLKEEWVIVKYYPITQELDPNWNIVREMLERECPDFFLFTHYFGKYHEQIGRAKEICKLNHILLIEDCAHVLYSTGKMGKNGDFVIYSPHKQLPVRDGAVLVCNYSEENKEIWHELNKMYLKLEAEKNHVDWYIKKAVQKIIPLHRKLLYYSGVHLGAGDECLHQPQKISSDSYHSLCDYDHQRLKEIAYIRRDNLRVMNYILTQDYPDMIPLLDETVDTPYMAVFSMEKISNKKNVTDDLLRRGFTVMHWPDLPSELTEEGHQVAWQLSRDIITFPIHQDVTPQKLLKTLCAKTPKRKDCKIRLKWKDFEENDWNAMSQQYVDTNIPQDWVYGDAKKKTEGWQVRRAIIEYESTPIGTIQLLEKTLAGIPIAVRVNRGPLLVAKYNNTEMHCNIMEKVRERYTIPIPVSYAPFVEMSPESLKCVTDYGWKCTNMFGYPSATIDLRLPEQELEKSLKPNWKKNLKKSKGLVEIKYNEYSPNEIMDLYDQFLEKKEIPGIPRHILEYLFSLPNPPLEVLTAHNQDGTMIAYKVLYTHASTATSFIAWNTDEGLQKNARTWLIYTSMLYLKERGYRYFDLGGVDDIHTEAVAKYKRGMGGRDYRLLGEFVKWF